MLIQYLIYSDLRIISQSGYVHNNLKALNNHNANIPYLFAGLSVSKKDDNLDINHQLKSLANKRLMSRNFIVHVLNKYWQETIFLSKPNAISDYYTNQLKADGISIYKNKYKNFLLEFTKALVTGRVQSSLDDFAKVNNLKNNNVEIQYIWRKGINFSLPKNFPIKNERQSYFPNMSQKLLIQVLKKNQLPLFTVTNNFNQIIVAEPSDELIRNKNIFDHISKWYNDTLVLQNFQKPIYEGLFFVNPEDAIEYKQYINTKNIYKINQNYINIFASSIDFYYKLVRKCPAKVQFRLIPDLKELGDLLYKYQFQKNISFHNQQKYGRYYFQGQPIYIIQPVVTKNKQTKVLESLNYTYTAGQDITQKKYQAVFMNYEVALLAWRNFVKQHKNYNLPKTPKILVHNLEGFLKVQENNHHINLSRVLIIPNQESYNFIKLNNANKSSNNISKILYNHFISFKIITKRIFWSLTSKQPINW